MTEDKTESGSGTRERQIDLNNYFNTDPRENILTQMGNNIFYSRQVKSINKLKNANNLIYLFSCNKKTFNTQF